MLLEAEVEQFWREGWILVRQLAPPRAVAAVLEAGQELTDAEGEPKWSAEGGGHQAQVFDHTQPLANGRIHALLREPAVYGAAAQLLGTEARVYYAFMAVVPGGGGTGLPWVRPPPNRPMQARARASVVLPCARSTRTTCTRTCSAGPSTFSSP